MVSSFTSKEIKSMLFSLGISSIWWSTHSSIAVLPPSEEWDQKLPRTNDGHLHPDVYWFASIVDIRAKSPNDELWLSVEWYYAMPHLEQLAKLDSKARQLLLKNSQVLFLSQFSLVWA
jgi:hypothetical protein